jgi:alkaline phosphatase D
MNRTQTSYQPVGHFAVRHAFAILLLCPAVLAESGFSSGVAAGDVTSTTALIWTRPDLPGAIRLDVSVSPAFDALVLQTDADSAAESDNNIHVDVGSLSPLTTYYYRFTRLDDPAVVSRTGRFRTPPADDGGADLRFVFSGDTNFAYAPFGVAATLAQEDADAFIWFGDTIYADVPAGGLGVARTLSEYRAKYLQVRSDPSIRDALATTPLITGGDDHEVTNDYAGGDPALSEQQKLGAYQAFFEYMPIRAQGIDGDPFRAYRRLRYGANVEVFVLDARQYRDPSAADSCGENPDPLGFVLGGLTRDADCTANLREPRSMLGRPQLDWLLNGLLESSATTKFVVNNVPMSFIGILPYDRWDGYDAERREILEFIHANQIQGVVILTTDIHANALNPDVSRYFREHRDYALSADVSVTEVIVGPLGNETLHETLTGFGSTVLTEGLSPLSAGFSPLSGLLGSVESILVRKLRSVNHFAMIETNRVSYAVLDVAADGSWSVAYRGLPPAKANDAEKAAETFYDSTQPASPPGAIPCGLPVVFGLAAGLVWSGARERNRTSSFRVRGSGFRARGPHL